MTCGVGGPHIAEGRVRQEQKAEEGPDAGVERRLRVVGQESEEEQGQTRKAKQSNDDPSICKSLTVSPHTNTRERPYLRHPQAGAANDEGDTGVAQRVEIGKDVINPVVIDVAKRV